VKPQRAVLAFGAAYGVLLAFVGVLRTSLFQVVHGPDLAFFTQITWSISRGHGFWQTVLPQEHAGLLDLTHLVPGLALLAPLQWLWPGPASLVAAQGLAWGSLVIPLHRFAERATGRRSWGQVTALVFALHPLGIRVALADFRPAILAVALVVWALERLQARRPGAAAVLAVLACSLREDIVVSLALIGPLAVIASPWGARLRDALGRIALPAAIALLWSHGGQQLRGSVSRFVSSERLRALFDARELPPTLVVDLPAYLEPFPFLAVLSPAALLPMAPNILGSYWLYRDGSSMDIALTDTRLHYVAVVVPMLVLAGSLGAARLLRWIRLDTARVHGVVGALVVIGTLLTMPAHGPTSALPWLPGDREGFQRTVLKDLPTRLADARELGSRIPDDEAVLVDMHNVHRFAARPLVYWYDLGHVPLYTLSRKRHATTAVLTPAEAGRIQGEQPGWQECWRGGRFALLQLDAPGLGPACER